MHPTLPPVMAVTGRSGPVTKSLILLTLLFASTAGTTTPAAADPRSGTTATYDRCMDTGDAARGVTVAIMDCLGAEIGRQDAALNRTYKAAMTRAAPAAKLRLRGSERAWIGQRDARCRTAADQADGGSLGGILYNQCVLDETIARTRWLARHATAI